MLATISYHGSDASDLGYLLHKNPARAQSFDLSVGTAHVFFPVVEQDSCTAALLLEIDPVELARSTRFRSDESLARYVNDRPYVSSSMLAVALGRVFRTAMTGRSDQRPELAAAVLPLEIALHSVPCDDGPEFVRGLFEPLGWEVETEVQPLDPEVPEWGASRYLTVTLRGAHRLAAALSHVYVMLPVIDGSKHYWVSGDEVDKLLRNGGEWLPGHPLRDQIMRRYLVRQSGYVAEAQLRLGESESEDAGVERAEPVERPLNRRRQDAVIEVLHEHRVATVVDLGCGPGALLARLEPDPSFTRIVGADVSVRALETAAQRLHLSDLSDARRARVELIQSSANYVDDRIAGVDAIVLMEVVEHIEPSRHDAVVRAVFGEARPGLVVVTTPNREYNALYPALAAGGLRHPDHRFEWTRDEFAAWAAEVGARAGYLVELRGIGEADAVLGSPTQLAIFTRGATR